MNKGKFISFEGIEGVGKSTTIKKIQSYLQEKGIEVCCTREPGGTEFGESIRHILLDNNTNITAESESLLLFSIRNRYHAVPDPSTDAQLSCNDHWNPQDHSSQSYTTSLCACPIGYPIANRTLTLTLTLTRAVEVAANEP